MNVEKHYNLRTIQFSLAFFCKIINDLKLDLVLSEYSEVVILNLLEAILRVSISHKSGRKEYNWGDNIEYGSINLKEFVDYGGYFTSFKFVHNYIYHGSYDQVNIKLVLDNYLEEISMRIGASKDPLNILYNYWELEDEIIVQNVNTLYDNLIQGKYRGQSYRGILSIIYVLKAIDLAPVSIEDFLSVMKENVSNGEILYSIKQPVIQKDDLYYNEYITRLGELEAIEISVHQVEKEDSLNAIFGIEHGWGHELHKYYDRNNQDFIIEKGFFKLIDIDKCFNSINQSTNQDLSYFRRTLSNIYNFSNLSDYFIGDVENIEKLNTMIVETNYVKMKRFNIKLLKGLLESIVLRIKGSDTKTVST